MSDVRPKGLNITSSAEVLRDSMTQRVPDSGAYGDASCSGCIWLLGTAAGKPTVEGRAAGLGAALISGPRLAREGMQEVWIWLPQG